ncbi:MAG: glycerol-3-phosphate acyltransferase [Bacteroidota bacterium]
MLILYIILCFAIAYLVGSLPIYHWLMPKRNPDSYPLEILGWFVSLLKGAGMPFLAYLAGKMYFSTDNFVSFQILLGIVALIGLLFPIFRHHPKERPLALLLGLMIILSPWISLCYLAVFCTIFIIWRYLSLAFIMASISYPLIMAFIFNERTISLLLFAIGVLFFTLFLYESNIIKLINKKEIRYTFGKKK